MVLLVGCWVIFGVVEVFLEGVVVGVLDRVGVVVEL